MYNFRSVIYKLIITYFGCHIIYALFPVIFEVQEI